MRNVKYSSIGGCALFSGMFAVKLGVNTNLLTTYGSDINELQCGLITRGKKTLHTGEYRPVFPRNLSEVSLDSSGDKVKLTIINIGKMSTCSTSICIFQSGVGAKYISGAIVYNMAPNIEGGDIVGSKIYLCHPNAYLLCPTMDEFAEDVTKSIRDCDPLSIISLDAQGCVRKVASNGHEYYAEWRNVARHLKYLDIIKMNEFEAQYAFGFSTIREVNRKNWYHVLHSVIDKIGSMAEQYNKRLIFMITLGSDGMLVGIGKWHLAYIEPFKVNEVDPFGAGDSCHVAFVKKTNRYWRATNHYRRRLRQGMSISDVFVCGRRFGRARDRVPLSIFGG